MSIKSASDVARAPDPPLERTFSSVLARRWPVADRTFGLTVKRLALAVAEYLLGFFALAVFAAVAFGTASPSDEHLVYAFKIGGLVAFAELAVLLWRSAPANRLIVGANVWLLAGGAAAFAEQWWFLKGYQRLGESSLFIVMLVVGVATTAFSPLGFVAALGERSKVILASLVLLACVGMALAASVHYRGDVKLAAVVPVIALSWLSRLLRRAVQVARAPE